MSYHDTPEQPLPKMEYVDAGSSSDTLEYGVRTVNSVGLISGRAVVRVLRQK
jgi:hypothetical protein